MLHSHHIQTLPTQNCIQHALAPARPVRGPSVGLWAACAAGPAAHEPGQARCLGWRGLLLLPLPLVILRLRLAHLRTPHAAAVCNRQSDPAQGSWHMIPALLFFRTCMPRGRAQCSVQRLCDHCSTLRQACRHLMCMYSMLTLTSVPQGELMSERGEPPASPAAALRASPPLAPFLPLPLRGRPLRFAGDAAAAAPADGGVPSAPAAAAAASAAAFISAACLVSAAISSVASRMVSSTSAVRARVSRVSSSCCLQHEQRTAQDLCSHRPWLVLTAQSTSCMVEVPVSCSQSSLIMLTPCCSCRSSHAADMRETFCRLPGNSPAQLHNCIVSLQ